LQVTFNASEISELVDRAIMGVGLCVSYKNHLRSGEHRTRARPRRGLGAARRRTADRFSSASLFGELASRASPVSCWWC
jgi:hypothetical protein